MDDLFITLSVMQKGYRCGYQADAIAYEDSSMDFKSELKRKGRICAGSLNVIKELSTLLIPFKSPIAFELWSHKVLRYCGGIILLLLLIVNIIIAQQPFYRDILVLQGIFYLLGTIGYYFSKKNITIPLFYYPFYFLFMNYSHLYAIKILLKQRRKFAWERVGR
jgi:cellulose synthase/poly-beta-1,6-N-acetylglucosamine synthase-like glycosyltransferase